MIFNIGRRGRRLVGAALLALALLALAGGQLAFAGRAVCRTDPIVKLSNGDVVTLYADLETDLSNVSGVSYVLHGPAGVSVVEVIHPIEATAALESFTYVADGSTKKYTAYTLAKVYNGQKIRVVAYMNAQVVGRDKLRSTDTNGEAGQLLKVEVSK